MKRYYECHVTLMGHPDTIRPHVEASGWTFSAIDGDPVLGAGVKCYATIQINASKNPLGSVIAKVNIAGATYRAAGLAVLREKVELVVYDLRFKL